MTPLARPYLPGMTGFLFRYRRALMLLLFILCILCMTWSILTAPDPMSAWGFGLGLGAYLLLSRLAIWR